MVLSEFFVYYLPLNFPTSQLEQIVPSKWCMSIYRSKIKPEDI